MYKSYPNKISCIIPCFNEERNLSKMINFAVSIPYFDQIILIDDGSTDQTSSIIRDSLVLDTRLIGMYLPTNLGKTGAVLTALDAAVGEDIVLLDADLERITFGQVEKMIDVYYSTEYEMVILDREYERGGPMAWTAGTGLLCGERILSKKSLLACGLNFDDRYLLESKLNLYFANQKKPAQMILAENMFAPFHLHKKGLVKGVYFYFKMYSRILYTLGLRSFVLSLLWIDQDCINSKLYAWYRTHTNIVTSYVMLNILLAKAQLLFWSINLKRMFG